MIKCSANTEKFQVLQNFDKQNIMRNFRKTSFRIILFYLPQKYIYNYIIIYQRCRKNIQKSLRPAKRTKVAKGCLSKNPVNVQLAFIIVWAWGWVVVGGSDVGAEGGIGWLVKIWYYNGWIGRFCGPNEK